MSDEVRCYACCYARRTGRCGLDGEWMPDTRVCLFPQQRREALLAQFSPADRRLLERPCVDQPDDIFVVTALEDQLGIEGHDEYIDFRAKYTHPGWRSLSAFLRTKFPVDRDALEVGRLVKAFQCGVTLYCGALFSVKRFDTGKTYRASTLLDALRAAEKGGPNDN